VEHIVSPSLSFLVGGHVTAVVYSRKDHMRRGSVELMQLVDDRACECDRQQSRRCCAVSSSPPQCGTLETVVVQYGEGSWPEMDSDLFSAEQR